MKPVIFSSVYSILLSALILALYIAALVVKKTVKTEKTALTVISVLTAVNAAAHVAIFAACIILKVPANELFFLLVASAALALTLIREKKPTQDEGRGEK